MLPVVELDTMMVAGLAEKAPWCEEAILSTRSHKSIASRPKGVKTPERVKTTASALATEAAVRRSERRGKVRVRPEAIPADCAGKWIAWDSTLTHILARGDTPEQVEAEAAKLGPVRVYFQYVPIPDQIRGHG